MDSFAVSVGMGTKHSRKNVFLGFYLGIYFAIFHVFMLFIGHVTGLGLYQWIAPYANLLSCVLLVFLGGKAIYGSYFDQADELDTDVTHKVMLLLAFITSIDAMAAGFTLTLMTTTITISVLIIGLITIIAVHPHKLLRSQIAIQWMALLQHILSTSFVMLILQHHQLQLLLIYLYLHS